jgi:hypothetical protein
MLKSFLGNPIFIYMEYSQEEVMIVEKFLDAGFIFRAASENEFNEFGGDYVKKFSNGMFCTEAPMPD